MVNGGSESEGQGPKSGVGSSAKTVNGDEWRVMGKGNSCWLTAGCCCSTKEDLLEWLMEVKVIGEMAVIPPSSLEGKIRQE